ncbi:MAG: hypothetical protein HGA29_03785, partial [Syntrophaceae bacterium]|nr:hypothetical protein [Syntrophaceae bacterium]
MKRNYFYNDVRINKYGTLIFFDNLEEGISKRDYESFIDDNKFKNKKFYKAFLNELSGCIYNDEIGRHTSAFIHLYRAYEHMSYAFPMIYSARTDDYIGTFDSLKKWMTSLGSEGNVGELKFHKNFIKTLFENLPEIEDENTVDIYINSKTEYRERIFFGLVKKVLKWNDPSSYTSGTINPDKIAIKFTEYHSFIVDLRNRFFHYSNASHQNIGLDDVVESDLLFSFVITPANKGINSWHSEHWDDQTVFRLCKDFSEDASYATSSCRE